MICLFRWSLTVRRLHRTFIHPQTRSIPIIINPTILRSVTFPIDRIEPGIRWYLPQAYQLILPDEPLVRGRFFILNDSYPSSEHNDVNGIPLAFLGAEKLVRIRIDWRSVHYPLSAYHTEMIIDLFLTRPLLVREIPKVHNFSLYRPLTETLRGWGYLSTIKLGLGLAW